MSTVVSGAAKASPVAAAQVEALVEPKAAASTAAVPSAAGKGA